MTYTNDNNNADKFEKMKKLFSKIDKTSHIKNVLHNIENYTSKLSNILKNVDSRDVTNAILSNLDLIMLLKKGVNKQMSPEENETLRRKIIDILLPKLENTLKNGTQSKTDISSKSHTEESDGNIEMSKRNTNDVNYDAPQNIKDTKETIDVNLTDSKHEEREEPLSNVFVKSVDKNFDLYLKHYVSNHEGLSESVKIDIEDYAKEVSSQIEIESLKYFVQEEIFLDKIKKMTSSDFFDNIIKIENSYNKINSVSNEFDMQKYQMLHERNIKGCIDKDKILLSKQSHFQALIQSLTENFNARKAAFEQKLIDEKRKKFLKQLYEKIENFKKLEEVLQPFIDDLGHGYLWDMSNAPFRNLGFDILQKYSSLLKNDKALHEFAELLGSQSVTSQVVEKQIIEETVIKSEYHPKPAQCGNIVGFEYSNEISRVLPSETALLNDPDLEDLFYLKFAEKQLLSYRYSQNVAFTYSETQQKEVEVSKSKDMTGPIIICVDTSGSMQGTPEQTAKIATFALAKIAMRQLRKCFLISFSTGIETLDMSDFKKTNALETLVGFLNKSFNGGTDATPALSECLRQLKTENYKNADVLMISDFVMRSLPTNIVSSIETEKKNGTFFYSLVIGQSANNQTIAYFNENINYNPYNEVSRQKFYKKIRQIAVKRNS